MSKIEEAKAVAINRRTFIKVSGMATGAAMLGGFHFVRRSHAAEGVIKLGFPAPLTGPYGAEAQDQQAGAELAVAQINDSGGVLGRRVELLVRDDKLKPDEAARQAKELIEKEGVELMAGVFSAACQVAVNEQCKLHAIPYLSTGQSNEITQRPDNSLYTYHEALDPHQTSQAVGEYAGNKIGKRWYFLVADYSWGWQVTNGFRRKGRELNYIDAGETKHPLGTGDFSSYIPRILDAKPDVLFVNNFGKDQINSLNQISASGLKNKMQIVCPIFVMSGRLGAGEDIYDGVIGGTSYYWEMDHPTSKDFVQAFHKMFSRPPSDYAGYAYSGVKELLSGANRAGSLDAEKLAEAIENRTYDNYKGEQWWRPCDHQSQQDYFIIKSKKANAKYDVFQIIATESGKGQRLLRSCVEEGQEQDKPLRKGLIKKE